MRWISRDGGTERPSAPGDGGRSVAAAAIGYNRGLRRRTARRKGEERVTVTVSRHFVGELFRGVPQLHRERAGLLRRAGISPGWLDRKSTRLNSSHVRIS